MRQTKPRTSSSNSSTREKHEFTQELLPSAAAVAEAKIRAATAVGPIVIADTQDNPGGGGHGDTTELLAELVRQKARGALVCLINDRQSAEACHAAGEGATVSLSLGGKSDGMPYQCSARVEKLTDGRFTLTGPMGAGNPGNLGPTALIDIDGVKVIVVTRKMQALDQAIIRHVGIEPSSCPILVLKSSVHFRADFGPIAGDIIVAVAPGPVVADPATLNFRHVRADVRRRPFRQANALICCDFGTRSLARFALSFCSFLRLTFRACPIVLRTIRWPRWPHSHSQELMRYPWKFRCSCPAEHRTS